MIQRNQQNSSSVYGDVTVVHSPSVHSDNNMRECCRWICVAVIHLSYRGLSKFEIIRIFGDDHNNNNRIRFFVSNSDITVYFDCSK